MNQSQSEVSAVVTRATESQTKIVGDWTYEVYYDELSRVCIRRWFGHGKSATSDSIEDVRDREAPAEVMDIVLDFVKR